MAVDITALSIEIKSTGIREASSALGGLSTSAANTEKRISALIETMKRLQSVGGTLNIVSGSSAALTAALNALNNTLGLLNQRTNQAENSQRGHNESMREAHALARGLSGTLGALWMTYGNFGGMLLGVALGTSIKEAISGFTAVEYQMTMAKALTEDTTNSVKSLTASMHEVSLALGISPEAAAKGLRALAQAGLSTRDALATLPAAFKLATVGEMELEAAALAATGVMNAYGLKVRDLEFIGDVMAKAGAQSAASVSSIAVSMKYAAGTADQYGVSLEKLGTVLTLLGKRGITGSSAGVAANNLIAEIYSPSSEKSIRAMAALGVKAYVNGVRQELNVAVGSMKENLQKFDAESQGKLIQDAFGKKSEKGFYAVAKAGQKEFLALEKELVDASGFTADVYRQSLQTIQGQMNLTKAAITNMFAQVGEESASPIKTLLKAVRELAGTDMVKDAFVGLSQSLKTFITYVVPAAAAVGTLFLAFKAGPPVIAAVTYAMSIFSAAGFAAAYGAVGAAVTGLIGAFQSGNLLMLASNPIVLGLVGVVTVLAGAYLLLRRNKESAMDVHKKEMDNSEETQKALREEILLIERKIGAQRRGLSGDALEAEIKKMENGEKLLDMQKEMAINEARISSLSKEGPRRTDSQEMSRMTEIDSLRRANTAMQKAVKEKAAAFSVEADLDAKRVALRKKFGEEERAMRLKDEADAKAGIVTGGQKYGKDPKGAKAAAADALQGELNTLQKEIKAARQLGEDEKLSAQSQYKSGLIGEVSLIRQVEAAEVKKQNTIAAAAMEKIQSMQGIANKAAAIANAQGEYDAAQVAKKEAGKVAANSTIELDSATARATLKFEADKFEKMGQFKKAYEKEFEASHKLNIDRLSANIRDETDIVRKGAFVKAKAEAQATYEAGVGNAANRDAVNAFNIEIETIRNTLKSVQSSTEGQGLMEMFNAATEASKKYKDALVELEKKKALITDDKSRVEADAAMTKEADNYRKVWVTTGEVISSSLESAFGKGGRALGELVKISSKFNALEDKTDKARVSAYGNAAGAAKNFFKEGTTGYKVLSGAEQAFRIVEMTGMQKSLMTAIANTAAKASAYIPEFMMAWGKMGPWGYAAGAAAIAAIGLSFSGGGGAPEENAATRQKSQGTGSVLGSDEKSNSIANSIEILAKNSGLGLAQGTSMVGYLRIVSEGIKGLAAVVIGRNTSITTGPADKTATTLGGRAMNTVFGGNRTTTDSGITTSAGSLASIMKGGFGASQYADVKKSGGWFSSDKTSTQKSALGSETTEQFTKVIVSMAESIKAASKDLGLGGDDFNKRLSSFVVDIGRISLKGLSGDAAQKELESVFSKLGDDMAKFSVVGLSQFQKIGEGYLETVMRVANSLIQVKDVFAVLGKTFDLTGVAAITVSEGLITAAGGLDKLTSGTKYFVDNFLTEAEKMGPITNSVTKRLKELGVSELTTVELYKKKIRALDLTNAADQKMYADLLELAPAFKEAADYADKLAEGTVSLTKAQQKALDNINKARDNLQKAYNAESGALQSTIDKTKTYVQTLKDFQSSLKLGANSPLTNMQKYAEAKSQLTSVGAAAQGGDVAAQQKFTSIANEFLNASRVINASGAAYTADFNAVQGMITSLSDAALSQIDVATASLAALNKQVDGLLAIDKSVMSVTQAITELRSAIEVGKTTGINAAGVPIVVPVNNPQAGPTAAKFDEMVFAMNANTIAIGELKVSGQAVGANLAEVVMDSSQENAAQTVSGLNKQRQVALNYN